MQRSVRRSIALQSNDNRIPQRDYFAHDHLHVLDEGLRRLRPAGAVHDAQLVPLVVFLAHERAFDAQEQWRAPRRRLDKRAALLAVDDALDYGPQRWPRLRICSAHGFSGCWRRFPGLS
jgi:hypothetical protein